MNLSCWRVGGTNGFYVPPSAPAQPAAHKLHTESAVCFLNSFDLEAALPSEYLSGACPSGCGGSFGKSVEN